MTNEYGPNYEQVSLFINRSKILTEEEVKVIDQNESELLANSARDLARHAAMKSAQRAAQGAAMKSAWKSTYKSAQSAGQSEAMKSAMKSARTAQALVVRDLISTKDFEILIAPCRFLLEELGIVDPLEV
jgi:activator of HSP90 ATPase